MRITVEDTPNPDARKFIADQPLTDGEREAFYSPEAAADHPLARRLFELPNVTGVMLLGDFCTVIKAPKGRWRTLAPKVKKVLREGSR